MSTLESGREKVPLRQLAIDPVHRLRQFLLQFRGLVPEHGSERYADSRPHRKDRHDDERCPENAGDSEAMQPRDGGHDRHAEQNTEEGRNEDRASDPQKQQEDCSA
ncbi:MAG: hypothetical protein NVSMB68_01850 [Thermoanaerobaculia bacterium]